MRTVGSKGKAVTGSDRNLSILPAPMGAVGTGSGAGGKAGCVNDPSYSHAAHSKQKGLGTWVSSWDGSSTTQGTARCVRRSQIQCEFQGLTPGGVLALPKSYYPLAKCS